MMAEMEWIVMTPAERARATVLNDDAAMLGSRRVLLGDLVGKWVVPARLLSDPEYGRWHETLSPLPRLAASADEFFPPPEPEPDTE